MTEAAKELRRKYRREWQRQNRDKTKLYQQRYWERQALKMKEAKKRNEEIENC